VVAKLLSQILGTRQFNAREMRNSLDAKDLAARQREDERLGRLVDDLRTMSISEFGAFFKRRAQKLKEVHGRKFTTSEVFESICDGEL